MNHLPVFQCMDQLLKEMRIRLFDDEGHMCNLVKDEGANQPIQPNLSQIRLARPKIFFSIFFQGWVVFWGHLKTCRWRTKGSPVFLGFST